MPDFVCIGYTEVVDLAWTRILPKPHDLFQDTLAKEIGIDRSTHTKKKTQTKKDNEN